MIDRKIHEIFEALTKGMRWHDFKEVGIEEHWTQYYYAEDRLYILKDVMLENYTFIEASSPGKALEIYRQRMEDATKAGSWVDEDPEDAMPFC